MNRELVAEPMTGRVAQHGEGPVWHPSFAGVRWVDMLAGDILELDGDAVRRTHVGTVAAAFRPRREGGLVVADERGFVLLDAAMGVERRLGDVWEDPGVRMNDGGCTPDGAFLCGSMAYDERPGGGALYRLAPDLTVRRLFGDVTISNGFAVASGGGQAYYVDTPTGRVDVLDIVDGAVDGNVDGAVGGRRPVVHIAPDHGFPDGLTVDAEGGIWVALWGGSAVHRYTAGGVLDTVVRLPVPHVTACTFGGPDLDRLFITTSTTGVDTAAHPHAGALFAVDPGVRGLPVLEFGG